MVGGVESRRVSPGLGGLSTQEGRGASLAVAASHLYTERMLHPDRLGARLRPWAIVLVVALCFILYELIQVPFYNRGPWWIAVGIGLSAGLGVFVPLFTLTRSLGIPFRAQFQLERPALGASLAVAGATLSLIPALEIITAAMARRYPPDPSYLSFVEQLRPDSWSAWVGVVLALAVAVPFAEELIFRGVLQRLLLRHGHPVVAVLLVAVLFGAVHPLYSIPGVTLLGVFFGVLALLLGNLTYPIIAHAVWNLANMVVLKQSTGELDQLLDSPFTHASLLWFVLSAALFAFFSRLWLHARV